MEIWPGRPTRWARRSTAPAPTSRSSARSPSGSSCACSTSDGGETRVELTEVDALRLALLPADGAAGPALRLPGARPVRPGARACAATRTSCCSTPTPRRSPATIDWDQSLFGYDFGDPDSRNDDDSGAAHDARRRDQPVLRLGGRPPARHPLQRVGHLRGARQGADRAAPRRPRGAARHLRRPRAPGGHRAPDPARRHRDRADAGAPVRPGQHAARQGPAQLLGLQHPRLLRPAQRLRRGRRARPAGAGVQGDGASRCTRPASRSSSTWSTTTPPRATTSGPTLSLQGHRQPAYYRLVEDDQQLLHGLHRHRELPQRPAPALAAADHGLAALLGDRDARRRLPLRPRRRPWPASSTTSTGCPRSSSSCSRTRSSAR